MGSGFLINPGHMAIENRIYMGNWVNTLFDSSEMAQRLRNGQKSIPWDLEVWGVDF